MKKHAVLFDIDGTLVESFEFDDQCYSAAVKEILGEVFLHNHWGKYEKVTDTGILKQILLENDLPVEATTIEKVRHRFGEYIQSYIENNSGCSAKLGSKELLTCLKNHSSYQIGIATGGWSHTAKMKLDSAGIHHQDIPLSSSDDHEDRVQIMQHCLSQLEGSFDTITYIGDAEWDIEASQTLGWNFIGVGPRMKDKCKVWVEDFREIGTTELERKLEGKHEK